jgi:integrase
MGDTRRNPVGVKSREKTIQIKFKLKGEESYCYETLPWAPTPINIATAGKLRAEIVEKIKHDVFSYEEYFPNSIRASNNKGTFLEYAQAWLDSPTNDWTPQTREKFKGILNRVWVPTLHSLQVRLITKAKVTDALATAIIKFKNKSQKDPSKSLFNDWLLCIRGVFSTAIDAGAIKKHEDPTQDIKNKTRDKNDTDPFEMIEANAIIDKAYEKYGDMWGAWFELGFYSGMRYPSEPSALLWSDVDLDKSEVRIHKIMTKAGLQRRTKTGKSRVLLLNSRCCNAINRLKAANYKPDGYLFINRLGGTAFEAKAQRAMWKAILGELGIRYRVMYNMRHTYATFGLMSGVNPAFMAAQLGHSVEEFFKTYAKWINTNQNQLQVQLIEESIKKHELIYQTMGQKWGKNHDQKN